MIQTTIQYRFYSMSAQTCDAYYIIGNIKAEREGNTMTDFAGPIEKGNQKIQHPRSDPRFSDALILDNSGPQGDRLKVEFETLSGA